MKGPKLTESQIVAAIKKQESVYRPKKSPGAGGEWKLLLIIGRPSSGGMEGQRCEEDEGYGGRDQPIQEDRSGVNLKTVTKAFLKKSKRVIEKEKLLIITAATGVSKAEE